MNLLTTAVAHAANSSMPYQSFVTGDHTVFLPRQDVLAVSTVSHYQPPYYPNDEFVMGYNPNPPLSTGAHAYASRYARNGSILATDTLGTGVSMPDAANLQIDNCTAVTFTALVFQGWMAMVGMVFTVDPPSGPFHAGTVVRLPARIVYDGETGRVHRLSEATVLPGATAPPASELDQQALAAAYQHAAGTALRLLVTDERPTPGHRLHVDLATGRMVATPPRTF